MLLTCQAGYEALLAREVAELHGGVVREQGPGWVRVAAEWSGLVGEGMPAFAHLGLLAPREVRAHAPTWGASSTAAAISAYTSGHQSGPSCGTYRVGIARTPAGCVEPPEAGRASSNRRSRK